MPQATEELREKWGESGEFRAMMHLKQNFRFDRFYIRPKPGYQPNEDDHSAIDYLVQEWDYAYTTEAVS